MALARDGRLFFQWMEPKYILHTWLRQYVLVKPRAVIFFQQKKQHPPPPLGVNGRSLMSLTVIFKQRSYINSQAARQL